MADNLFNIIVLILILIFILLIAFYLNHKNDIRKNFVVGENKGDSGNHQCGKSCNSLDDVLDPLLNVKLIVENALLIEDHMANAKRRCHSCLTKHFLLIIAFAEEAVWLAGSKCNAYPGLAETVIFYNEIFNYWLDNKDNEEVCIEVLDKLRVKRKQLMEDYILNGKEMRVKIDLAKAKMN